MSSRPMNAQWSIRYLPNNSGEAPGLRLIVTVFLVFLEQALSSTCDALNGLDHAEVTREALPPSAAPLVAVFDHAFGIGTKERVKQIIRVAGKQGSRQSQEPSCRFVEHSKRIPLGSVAGKLVDLVCDGVVPPFRHVAAHVFRRRHASNLVAVRLPKRRVLGLPFLRVLHDLVQALLLEVERAQPHPIRLNWTAGIRVGQ